MPRHRGFAIALALAGVIGAPAMLRAQKIDTLALRAHTRFLAHDSLEGRGTGSRGERLARLYIASQLERMGLQGIGHEGSYFQPVPLREAVIDHEVTRVVVREDGREAVFQSGKHFVLNTGGANAFRDFSGDAVFAGTAGLAHDALADAGSLKGKVVVVLGVLGSQARTLVPDWIEREASGVVLLIPNPENFALYVRSRGDSRYFAEAEVDDPVWQPDLPVLLAGPELSMALLSGSGLAPDALDGKKPFRALRLDRGIDATIRVTTRDLQTANVAGLIPGTDPELRDEVVVYTAHYDHLGIGEPDATGDSIYNGFSDNAAGTGMLLTIADAMRRDPPRRSVLFLFFTGEERGLLGSSYYASAPLIPLDRTVAVINLDAGAPPAPPRTWRVAGGTESTLGAVARRVAAAKGWSAEPSDASPNSDYWPFLQRGVPAIFLIPGQEWEGVSKAEKQALHERWDRYHQPGDEWAPDFPFSGLQRYAELAWLIGRDVADATERPRATTAR